MLYCSGFLKAQKALQIMMYGAVGTEHYNLQGVTQGVIFRYIMLWNFASVYMTI